MIARAVLAAVLFALPASAMNAPKETRNDALRCLSHALYGEARDQGIIGMRAVAEVVMNRVASRKFPATVCGVVRQPWQFSFVNGVEGWPRVNEPEAFELASQVAQDFLRAHPRVSNPTIYTERATHYHAPSVSPSWAQRLKPTVSIKGGHVFYREK